MSNNFNLNSDTQKTKSLKMRAFTLIELLVVIAIIALLLSIIVPSLNLAKRKAASAVCLSHVRNLSAAWYMYQEDNDGSLVNPNTTNVDINGAHIDSSYPGWVVNPFQENGLMCGLGGPVTDEDEIRGIEKGALFEYLKAPNVYRCPADNQRKKPDGSSKYFRTYSCSGAFKKVRKFTRITTPGMRFNFMEEAEGIYYWNFGTWDFKNMAVDGYWEWNDPVGINHGDSGILGFCDGHAEVNKWQESYTLGRIYHFYNNPGKYPNYAALNTAYPRFENGAPPAEEDRDIAYIGKGWADQSSYDSRK